MITPTRPNRHVILASLAIFGTIVMIGSFHDPGQALGLATIFVGIPWFFFYFLEWLGRDSARAAMAQARAARRKRGKFDAWSY